MIASLPESRRNAILKGLREVEKEDLIYRWGFWQRPDQKLPEGNWGQWIILAGRGWGKTKTGAESVREMWKTGKYRRIALVAPTSADARDVMVEGPTGILAVHPDRDRPVYEPSKRKLTWPDGATAHTYSADEPDRLRGPQHDAAWCDELSVWSRGEEAWDMLQFGLRLGDNPRAIVTMTPRPVDLVRDLVRDKDSFVTRGATYDNQFNLAGKFIKRLRQKYEGTRLGRQEIYAEILDDTPGALWTRKMIDDNRRTGFTDLVSVAIGCDPSISSAEESDECGLIAAGIDVHGHGVVLEDGSLRGSPLEWARAAVALYKKHKADCIVAEANQGGELVSTVLHTVDPNVPVVLVHATRGKIVRAHPVAALYERGIIHHICPDVEAIRGFDLLEEQMCTYVPGISKKSPDRMDALVWAFTHLFVEEQNFSIVQPMEENYFTQY